MAFTRRQSQNCGPSGGGIAAFGDGGADIGGTTQTDVLHCGGAATLDSTLLVTGVATAAAVVSTAGAGTITAANIITGTILRDCTGASRTDTLDTAANIVAALAAAFGTAAAIGDCIDCLYANASDPVTEIITVAAGSGGAFASEQTAVSRTILGTSSRLMRIRITGVAGGSEAYVVYL